MEPGDKGAELRGRKARDDEDISDERVSLLETGKKKEECQAVADAVEFGGSEKISTFHATMAFVKCSIGIGFLASPYAVSQAGWLGALIGFIVISFIVSYTSRLIIRAKMELKANGIEANTMVDMARVIFGQWAAVATMVLMSMTQLGVCILYTIFVCRSIAAIISPHNSAGFWYSAMVLAFFPVFAALSIVRSLTLLARFAFVALALMAISAVLVIVYGAEHGKECKDPLTGAVMLCEVAAFHFETYPVFIGIVTFGMEGICSVMPIHEAMAEPDHFHTMVTSAMACLGVLYAVFGIVAYQLFSSMTQSVISLNVEGGMGIAVKLMLVTVLVGTYPLQLFPLSRTIDEMAGWVGDATAVFKTHMARVGLVFFSTLVAIAVPYFGNVLSLAGAVCFTLLGFAYPVGSYLKITGSSAPPLDKLICAITVVLSIFIFVSGIVVNLQQLSSKKPLNQQ